MRTRRTLTLFPAGGGGAAYPPSGFAGCAREGSGQGQQRRKGTLEKDEEEGEGRGAREEDELAAAGMWEDDAVDGHRKRDRK
eukprot:344185-Hanusia_phi.AAC.2